MRGSMKVAPATSDSVKGSSSGSSGARASVATPETDVTLESMEEGNFAPLELLTATAAGAHRHSALIDSG